MTEPSAVVETAGADAHLVAAAITVLFVPGDRPERFAKATGSGADVVIIDLEDAVPPACKPPALIAVQEALTPGVKPPVRAMVRINGYGTRTYNEEIRVLLEIARQSGHGLRGVVLPKAEDPAMVARLAAALAEAGGAHLALVLLVESGLGVVNALDLARVPGVTRLALGAIDLALDLDADANSRVLDYARAQVVVASRAAGIVAPLDSPSTVINDTVAIEAAARIAAGFGFGGKLCIHPRQLEPVSAGFVPTADLVSWARSVVAAGDGAVQINGQMIDRPVIEKARRVLDRAERVLA